MRTFGSLMKAGYIPPNGSWLWVKNEKEPYLQFLRFNYSSNERTPVVKPFGRKLEPDKLFIHPYYPKLTIVAVKIIKPFPFGRHKMIHYLEEGILRLSSNICYTEKDIYRYPTFFKPIYEVDE